MKKSTINISIILFCSVIFFNCRISKKDSSNRNQERQKNILFIVVDDLRPELNFYGAKHIKSPNLDKLASQSLVFNKAYCNIPVCGASRASLLSGARPTRKRFIDARTKIHKDFPGVLTLPMLLNQNGYQTISNGKIYHNRKDDIDAWDEIWKADALWDFALLKSQEIRKNTKRGLPFEAAKVHDSVYRDGKLALKVIKDLHSLQKSNQPFFLTMGIAKPHLPFIAPKTVDGKSFVPIINGQKSKKDWAVSKFKDAVTLIKGDLFYTEWMKDDRVA